MQALTPNSNRPHGLDDILDRMNTESPWTPSWADICRVRSYVDGEWPADHSNVYDITSGHSLSPG